MNISSHYDWVVIGGGFKSLIAAYSFAKKGESVLLLERSGALGGFMSPIKWGEFWIDKGPQFFDNFEESDRTFMTEMVGDDVFEDIGFKYASYINGHKTDDFAIPDWRAFGDEFSNEVFNDLLTRQIARSDTPLTFDTFRDVLAADGGSILTAKLEELTHKFTRCHATDLSEHARKMVTYVGRKLLFDQDTSVDLKQSPLLDGLLAAQKKVVAETRYNLYPRGSNLETVRAAMEKAIYDSGVHVVLDCDKIEIDSTMRICTHTKGTTSYDRAFFGCDAREAETILFGTDTLLKQTHMLPEIFHCFKVPADSMDEAYYLVDYEPTHLATRMTNFSNYMTAYDADGNGVFCVEQAIDRGSAEWDNPELTKDQIFREAKEAGNITCDSYVDAKSFRIPVTYKVPLTGYVDAVDDLAQRTNQAGGDSLVIPNPMSLTRKETLDDLRALDLLV